MHLETWEILVLKIVKLADQLPLPRVSAVRIQKLTFITINVSAEKLSPMISGFLELALSLTNLI